MAFVTSFHGVAVGVTGKRAAHVCSGPAHTSMVATAERTDKRNLTKFDRMREKFALPEPQLSKTGFSYDDFEKAIDKFDYRFEMDDIVSGRVYQYEPSGALVDIGAKASAFIPTHEMSMTKIVRPEEGVEIGEDREFQIISREDANGQLRLSLRRIMFQRAWDRVAQLQAEDLTIDAEIISINRGGCLMIVEGLRAFLPGSHMTTRTPRDDMIGAVLPVKFLEVDPEKNRLVVSHRRAIVEKKMADLVSGSVVSGTVRGIKPYGVFVDMGGVSGLLHVSQISHDHVGDIPAILQDGDEVKVMILNQDKEKGRISLSTKTLEPEPGDMLRNQQMVYDNADEMAARYHKRLEEERKAAADIADDIVSTLDMASLDDLGVGPVDSSTEKKEVSTTA